MNELEIVNLYEKTNQDRNSRFSENINSSLRVKTAYDRVNTSFEWLEIMEETIRYLDNILRNPNRFIINEEDIVKSSIFIPFYVNFLSLSKYSSHSFIFPFPNVLSRNSI